jgi:hypothetical protein
MKCIHCGKPIGDEFPDNYFVTMTKQDGFQVHARCWPTWVREQAKEDADFNQFLEKRK